MWVTCILCHDIRMRLHHCVFFPKTHHLNLIIVIITNHTVLNWRHYTTKYLTSLPQNYLKSWKSRQKNTRTNKWSMGEIWKWSSLIVIPYSQCLKVLEVLVTQSCQTLSDSMNCSPPCSSVHGFSRQEYWNGEQFPPPGESSRPKDQIQVSHIESRFWATREAHQCLKTTLDIFAEWIFVREYENWKNGNKILWFVEHWQTRS